MSYSANELELASNLAVRLTEDFDFDCREIVSTEMAGESNGRAVFRIVLRLWAFPARVEKKNR